MFLTKECDYGVRIIRALSDGEKRIVESICEQEHIPGQYAYKILKKLERAGLVQGVRGRNGGYKLNKALPQISLFDIVTAIDSNLYVFECLRKGHKCVNNPTGNCCSVHTELERVQQVLETEMKRNPMQILLSNKKS